MPSLLGQRENLYLQLERSRKQIEELQQQIHHTQKLAALGTMSCIAAHEFNNILAPMINYAELALKHPDDIGLMRKALVKTIEQGRRAALIIESMMGLVRGESDEIQWVELKQLVDECFQALARDFSKDNITVKLDMPEGFRIFAVGPQIQQVLLNLILNSRHAMSQTSGGTLTISAQPGSGDRCVIKVSDTGCGMKPEVVERIFEPFFSTRSKSDHPEAKGTGLGLVVCREIIELHAGTIEVESQPNRGTTFTITLPNRSEPE